MTQIVHTIVCLFLWLGCVLSCPEDCHCTRVLVDTEVGKHVDCSHTDRSSFPSISEGALILDFSHNPLKVIPQERINLLHKLRELDFSNNRLGYDNDEGLHDDLFLNLVNLKILNLSSNYLTTFSPNTFNGLVQLEELDLNRNEIVHLPLGMFQPLPNTAVVCLGGNYWDCSMCQFHETLERYLNYDRNHRRDVCGRDEPSCSFPRAFRGRRFIDVRLENISVCVEEKPITTPPSIISTAPGLLIQLPIMVEASPHLIASANPHATTVNSTTSLSEFYGNSGNFIDKKTAKPVMASPHHDTQVFVAAIIIMGVMTLTIFLVFSIVLLKMQQKYRQLSLSHKGRRVDASSQVSPWPFLQGGQLVAMEARDTETMLQWTYEEIPLNYNSNHKNEHSEDSFTNDKIPEIHLDQPAKNGSRQFSAKADNPYKTVLHSQSNPMIAKLTDAAWETSFVDNESSDKTSVTDCSGAAALFMPLNNDNGLSQSTPYMVMHSPKENSEMKDLYFSFET